LGKQKGGAAVSIADILRENADKWIVKPPAATKEAIDILARNAGVELPIDYLEFLRFVNGGEGDLGIEPWYFHVWAAEEVIENNQRYSIPEFLPGFFGFGTNLGGELLAFDVRREGERRVFMIPMIPMSASDAEEIAPDFETFVTACGMSPPK
jgi:hypothetical protein